MKKRIYGLYALKFKNDYCSVCKVNHLRYPIINNFVENLSGSKKQMIDASYLRSDFPCIEYEIREIK